MNRALRSAFLAAVLLAALPSLSSAGPDVPDARTPLGPATVSSVWRGASTLDGRGPEVLTGVRIAVGPGGQGGPIRLRVTNTLDRERGTQLSPWYHLPAAPGVYTFPAPALHWDDRDGIVAIDQQVGGHAIVRDGTCTPEDGEDGDLCQIVALAVFHDLPDGDRAEGTATTPAERHPGQQIVAYGATAPDRDWDRVPDDEDRTDLQLAATRTFAPGGASTVSATVHNAGPRTADLPLLASSLSGKKIAWTPACSTASTAYASGGSARPLGTLHWALLRTCRLAALAPGASVTLTARLPVAAATEAFSLRISGDGRDLHPSDDAVQLAARPGTGPVLAVGGPARTRLASGVPVRLRTPQGGYARIELRVGGLRSVRWAGLAPGRDRLLRFHPRLKAGQARRAVLRVSLTTGDGTVQRVARRVTIAP